MSKTQIPNDASVHDEIEVSKHMYVSPFSVDKYMTEWEIHTGFGLVGR